MGKLLQTYVLPHPPIIVESVGKGAEKLAQRTIEGMERVAKEVSVLRPETVIIITPHGSRMRRTSVLPLEGSIKGDLLAFRDPISTLDIPIDEALTKDICDRGVVLGGALLCESFAQPMDHATFVPLWFIRQQWAAFKVVQVVSGVHEPKIAASVGRVLREAIDASQKDVVLILSGDQSHTLDPNGPYGFSQVGMDYENIIEEIFETGDFDRLAAIDYDFVEEAAQCGLVPTLIGLGAVEAHELDAEIYSHELRFGVGYLISRLMKEV